MLSAREGLELAADPGYRLVIFVLDRAAFDLPAWQTLREDLNDFLDSQVGPRDLVGLITTDRPWTDLFIGQGTAAIEDGIGTPEWLHAPPQEATAVLQGCDFGLPGRIRADETDALLESIIRLVGQVREDRTSIVFISNGLASLQEGKVRFVKTVEMEFTEAGEPWNTRPARSNLEPWQGQKKPPGQFAMTEASPGVKRVFGRQPRCVQVPISTSTSGLSARAVFLA